MTTALATAPMTAPQGRFLTSLLNDLTAVAPKAGAEARTRLHAQWAAGTLDKREASRAIDVLKQAIAVAKGAPAPVVPAQRPQARPVAPSAPMARGGAWQGPLGQEVLQACAKAGVTPGKRKGRSVAPKGPSKIMESLRNWDPTAPVPTAEEVGF